MHVFAFSFPVRYEGLVSQPPTMATCQWLSQTRNQRSVAKSGTKRHMMKMVFCTCTACV